VCDRTYIFTKEHTFVRVFYIICIYMSVSVCMYVLFDIFFQIYMHAHTYEYTYLHMYTYTCV